MNMESPSEGMRLRMFVWAASLALVFGGVVALVPSQHGPVVGPSVSRIIGRASLPASRLDVPWLSQSTSVDLASTSSVASLASLGVKRSTPVHLSIPAIGVSAPLVELGLSRNGSPQVPSSWYVPGWYKFGPAPGQLGSAVILGHVDSVAGPAVFDRLGSLKVGNRVVVKLKDGKTVYFSVIGLREYLKSRFPNRLVYGSRPYSALQLVTCGGAFDSRTGHYLSSIVVFTKQVKA